MTYVLAFLRIAVVAAIAVIGGLPAYDPKNSTIDPRDPNIVDVVYLKIDKLKVRWLVGLFLICVPLEYWSYIRAERKALKNSLKNICDALHAQFFADKTDEDRTNFRVTLFRVSRHWMSCWRRPCRLTIHARSGHLNLNSRSYFQIDDDHPDKNEGFAGKVFAKDCSLSEELPPCDIANPESDETKKYLKMSNMSTKRVRTLNRKSCSFYGTVIRKGGRKWGVLVLDGLVPQSVNADPQKRDLVDMFALVFSEVV